jgi:integrase/recombinase XerC
MSDPNIGEFISYLRVEKKYSPRTCVSYQHDLEQFFVFLSSEFELKEICLARHQAVRAWIVALMSEQFLAVSVNRKISSLRSFFRWALKKKKTDNNPMLKITAPKKPKKLPEIIPGNHITRLFETSIQTIHTENAFTTARDNFILELFYVTGMRRAELIQLTLGDFDLFRKEVRVTGKGNKVRGIPLTDSILHSYKVYLEVRSSVGPTDTDRVFITEKGKPVYEKLIYNIVRSKLANITTLAKKSPHVLRHTFATHMLDEGAELNAIKELLGHASLAATQVYTHNSISKLKEVYKKAHPEGTS